MELKLVRCALLSVFFALSSQSPAVREEIVRKHVSVKSPEIKSNVIPHFSPAVHQYEAEGNVIIDREREEVKEVKRPQNFLQEVSIQSPIASSSEHRHFDPAGHEYSALGELILKPDSPLVKYHSHIFQSRIPPPNTVTASSGLALKKSVSVHSPQRQSSVISHFNPAGHSYAATGNVVIDRSRPASKPEPVVFTRPKPVETESSFPKREPTVIYRRPTVEEKFGGSFVQTQSIPHGKSINSGLSLHKTVSVKTPERKSSVISHFTPAGHNYAATGNVVINRESSSIETGAIPIPQQKLAKTIVKSKPKITYVNPQTSVSVPIVKVISPVKVNFVPQKPALAKSPERKSSESEFELHKFVSVKSPERVSSVISHFDPAGHKYAATGDVTIHKKTSSSKVSSPVVTSIIKSTSNIGKAISQSQYKTPAVKETTVKFTNLLPVIETQKFVKVSTGSHETAQKVDFGKNDKHSSRIFLQKTVSVKSPENKSSVISHFTPAGHNYAATGNVVIDRASEIEGAGFIPALSSSSKSTASNVAYASQSSQIKPKPVAVSSGVTKTTKTASQSGFASQFSGFKVDQPSPVPLAKQPEKSEEKYDFKPSGSAGKTIFGSKTFSGEKGTGSVSVGTNLSSIKPVSSGQSVRKSVSVKSPVTKTSVISHFVPAGHQYAATGSVEIHRGAALGGAQTSSTFGVSGSDKSFVSVKSQPKNVAAAAPIPQISLIEAPSEDEDDSDEDSAEPAPTYDFGPPRTYNFESSKEDSPSFDFGPAPSYDPSEFAGIASYLPPTHGPAPVPAPSPVSFALPAPPAPAPPAPAYSGESLFIRKSPPTLPKAIEGGGKIHLHKVVSVQSPKDTSNVIAHFNPAKHVYKTTGEVTIDRSV